MTFSMRIAVALVVALVAGGPSGVRAQDALEARTKAFGEAVRRGIDTAAVAEFFPRRGAWTWVHTVRGADGDRVGVWRFEPADMAKATDWCGPLHPSFNLDFHRQQVGRLVQRLGEAGGKMRRVGRTRFEVPPSWAGRAAFVEWRREDGRWVVSSVGDESFRGPPLLGRAVGMITRDAAPAMSREDAYSTGAGWFTNNEPITFEGHHYIKYGRSRAIERRDLAHVGRFGVVRVYVARGATEGHEEIIYLPTGPGEYQPYETYTRPRDCARAQS